ncbi:nucleotidyltransferase family protein [Sphingosinithalassobacter portus]|uniref:nucleotidyltransferase domain-containing protein n=1 Tax=Stakelama portus TaxID=2676234 RepID=UPI000D6E24FC|nr:nucleotidyltransferase family protein [Sphingosinithalassobacter portus]
MVGSVDSRRLVAALREPETVRGLNATQWNALIAVARAEQLIGTLAWRLEGLELPPAAAHILADARASAEQGRTAALWEAEMARRALAPAEVPLILLKGTAFVAAGLSAGQGRHIGDLDILVPRADMPRAETAILGAGWEWVKPDPYDDAYYRQWMHELPPLIHRERDRMIDVHHTVLPLTARITPDAAAMVADSVALENGMRVLCPNDMLCHAAAHLFADGDLAGGLRNLWDIHCLIGEYGCTGLAERAERHGLGKAMARAGRLTHHLFGTEVPVAWQRISASDRWFLRRLLSRDGWGRCNAKAVEFVFYVRGHMLRMPPAMLARHLWTKFRKGYRPVG